METCVTVKFVDVRLASNNISRGPHIVMGHRPRTHCSSYKSPIIRASCCANDVYIWWVPSDKLSICLKIDWSEVQVCLFRAACIIRSYKVIRDVMWTICMKRIGLFALIETALFSETSCRKCKDLGSFACQVSSLAGSCSSS